MISPTYPLAVLQKKHSQLDFIYFFYTSDENKLEANSVYSFHFLVVSKFSFTLVKSRGKNPLSPLWWERYYYMNVFTKLIFVHKHSRSVCTLCKHTHPHTKHIYTRPYLDSISMFVSIYMCVYPGKTHYTPPKCPSARCNALYVITVGIVYTWYTIRWVYGREVYST